MEIDSNKGKYMLIDDKRAMLRMAGNEEMLVRADEFLAAHTARAFRR